MKIEVSPSILSADFGKLNEEIASIEAVSDRLHIDVMDGHFVPNISFGAPVSKWIKTSLKRDVHLMIENPWNFFDDFIKAGLDVLKIHEEVCREFDGGLREVLKIIKEKGVFAGVALKPATPVSSILGELDLIDQVLIMTVEPGFGGQEFMSDMVAKIRELRENGYKGDIGVDGGIDSDTAKVCVEAGANVLVAGSYIFGAEDRVKAVESLR